ncbi:MAG: Rpn family recombination-promoting nuclease/putative transposase [Bacteroidota bacterium]
MDWEPHEFISGRLSDLSIIYSVESKQGERIYALIHLEGQSTHDKNMAMRVWEYHVTIDNLHFKKGYEKIPLILTFVLYHGAKAWTSAKSISELFLDFDLYASVSLRSPFLVNLTIEEIKNLKKQGAAAAPQIIMKQQATGEFCEVLPELWELMKKHGQDDDENIDYMATNDKHEASEFLEKFSKLDPKTANDYKIMFEHAIQKEVKKATRKVKVEALQQERHTTRQERRIATRHTTRQNRSY